MALGWRVLIGFVAAATLLAGCTAATQPATQPKTQPTTQSATQPKSQETTESTAEPNSQATTESTAQATETNTAEPEPSETSNAEPTEEPARALLSREQLDALIRATPASKDLAGLKVHVEAIEEAASQLEPFEVVYEIGPTAVPEKVEAVINRFSDKLKMYQLVGLESLGMDWVLVSEKDYEWWVDYRLDQDADYPLDLWNAELNELGHCRLSSNVFCGAGNTVNGKEYQDNVVGTRFTDRGIDYVSRHEAAHFYQAVFGYGGKCWFAEGQATFFETYLETSSRSRSQVIATLRQSPSNVAESSETRFFELLESDGVCFPDYRVAYDLGMLVFEYLYMNFSLLQVHELMVLSSNGSWDQAVAETLGVNAQDLSREIASYLFSALN